MQRHILPIIFSTALPVLAGCASTSSDIEPVHTSTAAYANLSCQALHRQGERVDDEIVAVTARIDETSPGDRLAMGVGVVFWPALFMIDGNGDDQDKLAVLKGQRISIDDTLVDRNCEPPNPKLRAGNTAPQAKAPSLTNPDDL